MTDDHDIFGGAPDGKEKIRGIVCRETCQSSFEMDVLYRGREAMASLRAEFNQSDDPIFEEDPPLPTEPFEPLGESDEQLLDLENAILAAAASLWATRVAVARVAQGESEYRRLCAADNIDPGF
jgi:hypothetical protein